MGMGTYFVIIQCGALGQLRKGLQYDFDSSQLEAFDEQGYCLKEFWLPLQSASNPASAQIRVPEDCTDETWRKCAIPLSERYRSDFLNLDVRGAVSSSVSPLLVIHGDRDRSIPLENGEELFDAAAEPKEMVVIKGGDHLLRSSKTASKAIKAILFFVSKWAP